MATKYDLKLVWETFNDFKAKMERTTGRLNDDIGAIDTALSSHIDELDSNLNKCTAKIAKIESIFKAKIAHIESNLNKCTAYIAQIESDLNKCTAKIAQIESNLKPTHENSFIVSTSSYH